MRNVDMYPALIYGDETMRWDQTLKFTALRLPFSIEAESQEGLRLHVHAERAEKELVFSFEISGREKAECRDDIQWYYCDHTVFFLDIGHDHMTERMIAVQRNGKQVLDTRIVLPGEEPNERKVKNISEEGSECLSAGDVFDKQTAWGGTVILDLNSVTSPVIGFAVKGVSGINPVSSAEYPDSIEPWARQTPLAYTDIYLDETAVSVDRIQFGEPEWKENRGTIRMSGAEGSACSVRTEFVYPGHSEIREQECNAPESSFAYMLDPKAKWTNGIERTAYLCIDVASHERSVWSGSFPVSFDSGIIARDRTGGTEQDLPDKSDPDFPDRMREYLLSHLPDFTRVSTRDGAPGDFCLKSDQLNETVNLLDEDIYGRIADIIGSCFAKWEHGFAAGAVFLGSAAGIRHSSQNAALAASLSPQGILQLGAGFCGQQSECYVLLAEKLADVYRRPLNAYTIGLRGHIAAAVRFRNDSDYYIFDPMLGLFFYAEDNTEFASLSELRSSRELSHRMDAYCSAHGHEFYYGIDNHIISPAARLGRSMCD